jgi:hypothetical protein
MVGRWVGSTGFVAAFCWLDGAAWTGTRCACGGRWGGVVAAVVVFGAAEKAAREVLEIMPKSLARMA